MMPEDMVARHLGGRSLSAVVKDSYSLAALFLRGDSGSDRLRRTLQSVRNKNTFL